MNEAGSVGRIKCIRDLDGKRQKRIGFEWSLDDPAAQYGSFKKLHRDEDFVFVLANFIDGADVGMIQRGGRTRFATKSFQSLGFSGHFVGQKLQSYIPAKFSVHGFVNDTHASAPDFFEYAVVRDDVA
jgi:hypothetical protein